MIGFKFIVLLYDDCLLLIKLRQVDNNGVKGFFFFFKKFLKKKKKNHFPNIMAFMGESCHITVNDNMANECLGK